MPFGPRIASGQLVLRPSTPADIAARSALGHDPDILRMLGIACPADRTVSLDAASGWIASLGVEGVVEWVVEHASQFVGVARLHSFHKHGRCCRYAVALFDPAKLGQGIGRTMTRLVLRHAFDELGVEDVELVVLDFNERAQRCYRACGFREVARLPTDVIDDGHPASDVLMRVHRETLGTP